MTPKEKAKELVDKFYNNDNIELDDQIFTLTESAKECALICVNEIIELTKINKPIWYRNTLQTKVIYSEYWLQVEQEINKL